MRRFIVGFQSRLLRRLPVGVRLYPLDLTFCALGIPSAIFTLLGVAQSRSLTVMPVWAQYGWALMLLLGCISWAVGTLTAKQSGNDIVITRVELMIFGLTLVSGTAFVYALAMILVAGTSALIAVSPLIAFAIGTYLRRVDLIGRMKDKSGP